MKAEHGGKRANAGRKKIADVDKKKTVVIRVDELLLPVIEQLKCNLNYVTNIQDEIERLIQMNNLLVEERDNALKEVEKLQTKIASLEAKNSVPDTKPNKHPYDRLSVIDLNLCNLLSKKNN